MKRKYIVSLISACLFILVSIVIGSIIMNRPVSKVKAGYIFVGDHSTSYTTNFIHAAEAVKKQYDDRVENVIKYNIPEGSERRALEELVAEECDIIFACSYGYKDTVKEFAERYPDIHFCMSTGDNANDEPVLKNYHTYMGHVYEGRYLTGIAAGLKIQELIDNEIITEDQAWVGYVAAFPYAEVISGYTAFYLGIRSVVPSARMKVIYTNTWSDYAKEKVVAQRLIDEDCVIISEHSDTSGSAVACEMYGSNKPVYHISYNDAMHDIAPTKSIIGCRINWAPYMVQAVGALLNNKRIEDTVDAVTIGQDAGAGVEKDWVKLLRLNKIAAAEGTEEELNRVAELLKKKSINVFKADLTGTDPFDPSDTIDLSHGYKENATSSAPTFHYVLDDVIIVEE